MPGRMVYVVTCEGSPDVYGSRLRAARQYLQLTEHDPGMRDPDYPDVRSIMRRLADGYSVSAYGDVNVHVEGCRVR